MLIQFSDWLNKISSRSSLVVSLSLYILLGFGIMPNVRYFIPALAGAPGPLDLMFAYTPVVAFERIAAYGPEGRIAYAILSLSADVVYPIVYTVAFGILITVLARVVFSSRSSMRRLNLLPVGIFFFDMCENASIVTLLMIYPAQPVALGWAASAFTTIKWIFAGAAVFWSVGLIAVALFLASRRR